MNGHALFVSRDIVSSINPNVTKNSYEQKEEFWNGHSSWVEMKCLVATSLFPRAFQR